MPYLRLSLFYQTVQMKTLIKIIFYTVVSLLFFSCISEKKRSEICNSCPSKSEIVYKDKYRDTTIFVESIELEPFYMPNPCANLCDSFGNLIALHEVIKNKKGNYMTVSTSKSGVFFSTKIDSLKAVIKVLEKNRNEVKEIMIKEDCKRKHTSPLDFFFLYSSYIFYVILLIYLIFKLIKTNMKKYILSIIMFIFCFSAKSQTLTQLQRQAYDNKIILRDQILFSLFTGSGTGSNTGLNPVKNSFNMVILSNPLLGYTISDTIRSLSIVNTGTSNVTFNSMTILPNQSISVQASGYNGYYMPYTFTTSIILGGSASIMFNK